MIDVSLILVRIGMPQWLFSHHLRKFAAFPVSETVWRSPPPRLGERGVAIEAVALGCDAIREGAHASETGQDERRTGWEVEMRGGSERLRLLEHSLQRSRHVAQSRYAMRMDDALADAEEVRSRSLRRFRVNLAVADIYGAFRRDARAFQA